MNKQGLDDEYTGKVLVRQFYSFISDEHFFEFIYKQNTEETVYYDQSKSFQGHDYRSLCQDLIIIRHDK